MKNHGPCLTALSLYWFLWDIKEATLLFVKRRGHRPWWCGTTVKWAGWEMNSDASLVSFPVPVLSHHGQFNKELEEYCNAWPSRSGFHHHHHHHYVSSRQYVHQASMLSDQHFLSCATALATAQLFNPTLFHSFSTVCHLGATMEPIGLWTSSWLCPKSINAAPAVTPPISVVSLSMLLFSVTIDLIHDTCHLCTPFRIDGIKAMSGGISGGKQKIKFANARNCSLLCLFSQNKTTI